MLIDAYLLRSTATPLALALTVVLVALLMERLLRLLNMLSEGGGRPGVLLRLLAELVPHYLGLALPAAFFISVLSAMTRLSESSEIEALQASGVSLARISAPLVALGVALAAFSVVLFGFMQPYSRYAYREVLHTASTSNWPARVQPQVVAAAAGRFTLTADRADATGRRLQGVFLRRDTPEGEQVFTAKTASVLVSPDGRELRLTLRNGTQVSDRPDGRPPVVVAFESLRVTERLNSSTPFRSRGQNVRELTLPELGSALNSGTGELSRSELASELHARLARSLSIPFLPLLAVPLGLTAKRSQGWVRLVFAATVLLAYHHALQLGESLGDTGQAPPALAVWLPTLLFAGLSTWLFVASRNRAGDTPLSRALHAVAMMFDAAHARLSGLHRKAVPA